tara:strand:+ start:4330 stop:4509 length:180 start_codon:yes stop_codon:yes gene_type:complete
MQVLPFALVQTDKVFSMAAFTVGAQVALWRDVDFHLTGSATDTQAFIAQCKYLHPTSLP